jgi:ferredoxin
MTSTRIPFSENLPGDYYVEDGCCTSCGMPTTVAPDLFSYANDGHCYVSKQPADGKEVFQMLQAFAVQDIGCIRYKGLNRVIQIKLIAAGEGDQCDQLDEDLQALNQEVQADRCGLGK